MQALSEVQAAIRAALLLGPILQVPSCSLQHVTAPVGLWDVKETAGHADACLLSVCLVHHLHSDTACADMGR